jgi:thioredoxin reductase
MPEASFDVAIVGGGPAGIAAACELRRRGIGRVAVFDRETTAGGAPRHCGSSAFGWREFGRVLTGPAYARRLVERARRAGVELRPAHSVVGGGLRVVDPAGSTRVQAGRVILATGARETPPAARLISGDRPIGCLTTGALQSFIYLEGLLPVRRPLVVGTELVSLSALITCRRAGIRPVAVLESNPCPTAPAPLGWLPRALGIPLHLGAELTAIHGGGRVECALVRLASGAVREIACDGILFTGGFVPEAALAQSSHLLGDPGSRGPSIDQHGRCSDPAFFADGNVLRGVESAGWSYAEGVRVGRAVAADLAGELPGTGRHIAVLRGPGVKLVVPQRVLLPANGLGLADLQVRLDGTLAGTLRIEIDDALVWQRDVKALPERRLLVPLAGLPLRPGAQSIRFAIAPASGAGA